MKEPYGVGIARLYLLSWPCLLAAIAWSLAIPGRWPLIVGLPALAGMWVCSHHASRGDADVTGWQRLTVASPIRRWQYRFTFGLELKRALRLASPR